MPYLSPRVRLPVQWLLVPNHQCLDSRGRIKDNSLESLPNHRHRPGSRNNRQSCRRWVCRLWLLLCKCLSHHPECRYMEVSLRRLLQGSLSLPELCHPSRLHNRNSRDGVLSFSVLYLPVLTLPFHMVCCRTTSLCSDLMYRSAILIFQPARAA